MFKLVLLFIKASRRNEKNLVIGLLGNIQTRSKILCDFFVMQDLKENELEKNKKLFP
jgi:hypothetical protein